MLLRSWKSSNAGQTNRFGIQPKFRGLRAVEIKETPYRGALRYFPAKPLRFLFDLLLG
jgi:hypothetical protein